MSNDEPDYEDDIEEMFGDDPDPPQGTRTLEERKAVHEAFEISERLSGDERAPYSAMCAGTAFSLGVCRHTDVQEVVGEWMWKQLILKNRNVIKFPIHVFRRHKLRYVYTVVDVGRHEEFTLVTCEKVTIPAGMVQEALLEDVMVGFRFIGKTEQDLEEGL